MIGYVAQWMQFGPLGARALRRAATAPTRGRADNHRVVATQNVRVPKGRKTNAKLNHAPVRVDESTLFSVG